MVQQGRVAVNGKTVATERFRLIADPRVKGVTAADYAEQFRFLERVSRRFSEANDAVKTIRYVRREIDDRRAKLNGGAKTSFDEHANPLMTTLTSVEDSIYQTKSRSSQDPLNYPIRINNKLGALMGVAGGSDGRPRGLDRRVPTWWRPRRRTLRSPAVSDRRGRRTHRQARKVRRWPGGRCIRSMPP